MAETSTIFGFMKYVSATDILSDFKKTVDSHFVNILTCNKLHGESIYCHNKYKVLVKKINWFRRTDEKNKKISGPHKTR